MLRDMSLAWTAPGDHQVSLAQTGELAANVVLQGCLIRSLTVRGLACVPFLAGDDGPVRGG